MKNIIGLALCLLLWTGLKSQVLFGEVDFVAPSDMIGSFYIESTSNIIFTNVEIGNTQASYNYSNVYANYFSTTNDSLLTHPTNMDGAVVRINREFVKDDAFSARVIKPYGTEEETVAISISYVYNNSLEKEYQIRLLEYPNNGTPTRKVQLYSCNEQILNNGQPSFFEDWTDTDLWEIARAGNTILFKRNGEIFHIANCQTQNTTTTILMKCFEHQYGPHLSDYSGLEIIPFTPTNMDLTGAQKSRKVDRYGDCHVIVHSWK